MQPRRKTPNSLVASPGQLSKLVCTVAIVRSSLERSYRGCASLKIKRSGSGLCSTSLTMFRKKCRSADHASSMLTLSQSPEAKGHFLGIRSGSKCSFDPASYWEMCFLVAGINRLLLYCVLGNSVLIWRGCCILRLLVQFTKWRMVTSLFYRVPATFFYYKLRSYLPDTGKVKIVRGLSLKGCTERVKGSVPAGEDYMILDLLALM